MHKNRKQVLCRVKAVLQLAGIAIIIKSNEKGCCFMAFEIYDQQRMRPICGVLFDMDGVILDTEKLYARFWREACIALGYPMTHEQALGMRSLNRQAGQAKLTEYFGPGISHPEVRKKRIELMDAYVEEHGVDPLPGVVETLTFLKEMGIPCAITTSSPYERVEKYLGRLGYLHLFDKICTGYEVAHGKPEPDIYIYGAESLGLKPEQCLAIEDSPAGITSASRAGCLTVMIPDQDPATEEMKSKLFALADSLQDLVRLVQLLNQ